MLFVDPTGVRILYDPGRTVNGATDPRLGDVHVILLSHAHGDHIGDQFVGSATCAGAANGAAFAQSNLAAIAAAKNSAVAAGGELAGASTATFLNRKIQNVTGAVTQNCPATGLTNEFTVPRTSPCVGGIRVGASRTVRFDGAPKGVKIAAVQAVHPNGIPAGLVDAASPGSSGTPGYGGDAIGFVVTFTNGLSAYLTGDTGMFGDMETIIRRYYRPKLVVYNIGDIFTTGPDEAAFTIRELLHPATVIPSHTNEASTTQGAVTPGSRLERFIQQVGDAATVAVPLSDVTLCFDGSGEQAACAP
jgi:L-ascorbate metabolism protein UlaG (beta-lactamase superfamily)